MDSTERQLLEERLNLEFVKDVASDTRATAVHVKVNKKHYLVVKAWIPKAWEEICAMPCTRTGRVEDFSYDNCVFAMRSINNTLEDGVDELLRILDGGEPKPYTKPPLYNINTTY